MVVGLLVMSGCATTKKIDWDNRIGSFTFDQAVTELGPPDKSAKLNDGTSVCEWLIKKGYSRGIVHGSPGLWVQYYEETSSPDVYLRLTFGSDGKLISWKKIVK